MEENAASDRNSDINILYEEGSVIAINKPSGLLTQAPVGIDSLEFRVKNFLIQREQKTGKCYLGIPHRLDRPASGVMIFARNSRAANYLCEQFRSREIEKKYWAITEGVIESESGTWIDYMRKIPGKAEAELIEPIHPEAREAVLHFKVLGRFEKCTWLEIELETGRTHQIRLQCSSRGFPLLGDTQYGGTIPFGPQYDDDRLRAIALHSRRMVFVHPQSKETVELVAPLSDTWREWIPGDRLE